VFFLLFLKLRPTCETFQVLLYCCTIDWSDENFKDYRYELSCRIKLWKFSNDTERRAVSLRPTNLFRWIWTYRLKTVALINSFDNTSPSATAAAADERLMNKWRQRGRQEGYWRHYWPVYSGQHEASEDIPHPGIPLRHPRSLVLKREKNTTIFLTLSINVYHEQARISRNMHIADVTGVVDSLTDRERDRSWQQ